jgi:hypothetical protein
MTKARPAVAQATTGRAFESTPDQTIDSSTSMLPRVAFEYGQT